MNWLDIAIIVVVVISAAGCLFQGAIRAVFGAVGLLGGIFLAGHHYQSLASILFVDAADWAKVAAYATILLLTLVAALVIGWIVERLIHLAMLGWLDKLIGFVLGAGLGAILCAAIITIVSRHFPGTREFISQSILADLIVGKFPLLLALLPEEFEFIKDLFD